jgi:hypothetical protein
VLWARVPEATIDEDGEASAREHDVRPGPLSDIAIQRDRMVNAEPQAFTVEE